MHTLEEILKDARQESDLCQAIEKKSIACFNKKGKGSKYCGKHQSRLSRYKSFDLPTKKPKVCKFIDCPSIVVALGYCNRHYRQRKLLLSTTICKVENCFKRVTRGDICDMHRIRLLRHGDVNSNFSNLRFRRIEKGNIPYNKGKNMGNKCLCPGCEIKNGEPYRFVKGLCRNHFRRWKLFGDYKIASKKEYLEKLSKKVQFDEQGMIL